MEMKKTKKLSMLLMVAIAFALLFGMQLTAHAEVKKGSCGVGVNWTYDTDSCVMTITGSGEMLNWSSYSKIPWYSYVRQIKKVIISDGITNIGDYAFFRGEKIKEVILPNSTVRIGKSSFYGCSSLENINWPDQLETIEEGGFQNCYKLKSVELKGNVREVGKHAFANCFALTNLKIADGVTSLGYSAFSACRTLKRVSLPASITSMGEYLFYQNYELTTVQIAEGITEIPNIAFYDCKKLVSVSLPSTLKTIGKSAFYNCEKLEGVILPEGLEVLEEKAFIYTGLRQLRIPSTVKKIGASALADCENLTRVAVLNKDAVIAKRAALCGETLGVLGDTTVYGYPGSTAQTYSLTIGFAYEYITESNLWQDTMVEASPFDDVRSGTYYFEPIKWAVENNITSGLKPDLFGPEEACTRGQIVTFLWRAKGEPQVNTTNNPFIDVNANYFYYKPVLWAVDSHITAGISATQFAPEESCTRGQIVTFLWRAAGQPKPTSAVHTFKDIKAGQYYYDAVLWAVENGITAGLTSNEFGPEAPCTRGQIVTFLYRAYR